MSAGVRRREFLGAAAVGGLAATSGCLGGVARATRCSPTSRAGLVVWNNFAESVSVDVEIETSVLGREVFSDTFDVPAASGSGFETVREPAVVPNLGSYEVTATFRDVVATRSWQVTCRDLHMQPIELAGDYSMVFTTDAEVPGTPDE